MKQWVKVGEALFASPTRLPAPQSKAALLKWQKEVEQASILSKRGHTVYLVSESGPGKHYDALVDGRPCEMKTVQGNITTVGKNFTRALKQGRDVFLRVKTETTAKRVYSKLVGSTKVLLENGAVLQKGRLVYLWLDAEETLHLWYVDKIIQATRRT